MELPIYNEWTLDHVGIIETATEFQCVEKLNQIGWFKIWIPRDEDTVKYMNGDYIVALDASRSLYGIIEKIDYTADEKGKESLMLSGRTTQAYLSNRIIYKMFKSTTLQPPSIIMENIMMANCYNTAQAEWQPAPKRVLDFFVSNFSGQALGTPIEFQRTGTLVSDALEALCAPDFLGWRVNTNPHNKTHGFESYQGIDRSITQSVNDRVVFAKQMDNIIQSTYNKDKANYKNWVQVAGAGEGLEREYINYYDTSDTEPAGLKRKEFFADARDLQPKDDEGNEIPIARYRDMLTARGKQKMGECEIVENFVGTIMQGSQFQYGVHYNLGDKVTFADDQLGITLAAVVTESETVYKGNNLVERRITFGFGMPNMVTILSRRGLI